MVVSMYVVLVYDISQEKNGAKRWSKVFKISKKYLSHIQNSVFEGEISKPQLSTIATGNETLYWYRMGFGYCI